MDIGQLWAKKNVIDSDVCIIEWLFLSNVIIHQVSVHSYQARVHFSHCMFPQAIQTLLSVELFKQIRLINSINRRDSKTVPY